MQNKYYVLSLGGSLIVSKEGIDYKFLKKFRALIIKQIKQGKKFIIITGGGVTCRNYIQAADRVIKISNEDKDWLGIHSTRLNAHLLRTILFDIAHPEIITNPNHNIKTKSPVIIGAGWKPGWSTDYDAVILAKNYNAKTVINLSNIDYAYNKDPKKYKDAVKIKETNWPDFRKIVGNKWIPGLNMPFDPIASKLAEELKLKVVIMNGKKLKNLEKCLDNKKCMGTVIE